MPHGLLDGTHREIGLVSQQCPLFGMLAQHLHRRGQLTAGGVGAGDQDAERQHAELAGIEPVTAVLDPDQF